ncbi:MAG: DUF2163 domain-containing protein [Kiloniellaceae bacterium]
MKTVSAALAAHLSGAALTLATCWKVKRTDGTVLGFTAHDRDIVFDLGDGDGAATYAAASGFTRTGIESAAGFAADNLDVQGILDSTAIAAADIRAGRYDFAEVKVFEVNTADLGQGALKLRRGHIGQVRAEGGLFVAELRGLIERYAQEIGELYGPSCRADLGDARCKARLDPPVWQPATAYAVRAARDAASGSVVKPSAFNDRHFKCVQAGTSGATEPAWNTTFGGQTADGGALWEAIRALTVEATVDTVTDNRTFTLTYGGDAPDALLTGGLITFLDGASPGPANAGLKMEVKSWSLATKTIALFLPMPFAVASGDAVTVQAGCDKSLAVCRDTFDNVENFRGEPFVPGNDLLFRTPDAR